MTLKFIIMSDKKLNDIISKIYDIKMSYICKTELCRWRILCIIMSFKIKRHNIARVISWCVSFACGIFSTEMKCPTDKTSWWKISRSCNVTPRAKCFTVVQCLLCETQSWGCLGLKASLGEILSNLLRVRLWPVWSLSRARSRLVSHGAERDGRNEAAPCWWNKAGSSSPTGLPPRVWVHATLGKCPASPIAPKFSWTSPLPFGWTIHPSRVGQTPITYSCACNDDIGHQCHAGFNPLH